MLSSLLKTLFGDAGAKYLKTYLSDLEQIKLIEIELAKTLTDENAIKAKTAELMHHFHDTDATTADGKERIAEILESIKHEAIATHRIACKLLDGSVHELSEGKTFTWRMVPYDVQILGALALNGGNIAEMRTGEGKTLVATIAAYLNALTGSSVHVVTVNDYLARRDAMEMGILYRFLGLSVAVVSHGQSPSDKRVAYSANIVYATNNELGFDYLRDNMAPSPDRIVQSPLRYAIVDEVDSILVDEARTPLIISAPDSEPTSKYLTFAMLAKSLDANSDYKIDEKQKTATLTEDGIRSIEKALGVENIYLSNHANDIHHIENALKARAVYHRDIDYLVRGDDVMIIDEHTGRVLAGRRYSDGLHQAIEAKENVTIQQESKTLASITFQNLFRIYDKLSGMTGTAKTEEEEFYKIYRLTVVEIPTNRPMIRDDMSDLLFKNEKGKFDFTVALITALHEKGQSILVGTVSVAKSEYLSSLLETEGIPHQVLNAKQDANEAQIVGAAGQWGAVTIATNMAGRGTDIKLDPRVAELSGSVKVGRFDFPLGGLFVIGTEKHETRRIDNQLRGRSGRQGDPGASVFMVSPQDDIMRIFGGDKLFGIFNSPLFAAVPDNEPLNQSGTLTKRITTVQKQVEGRNFDIRKHVLEYDDVLDQHRKVVYSRRRKALYHSDIDALVSKVCEEYISSLQEDPSLVLTEDRDNWIIDTTNMWNNLSPLSRVTPEDISGCDTREDLRELFLQRASARIATLKSTVGQEEFNRLAHIVTLQSTDMLWMEHIDTMTHLKEEVAFEGYAQKNPLVVYREKAYEKFDALLREINHRIVRSMLSIDRVQISEVENQELTNPLENGIESGPTTSDARVISSEESSKKPKLKNGVSYEGIGRNDLCPCGSGKKFKQCHGK